MNECIFCKIISKKIPATIIYEDDHVIAFNDINPVSKVHVLVLPKTHIESLREINKDNAQIIVHIHLLINELAKKLGVYESGFRVVTNCGVGGGQSVFHLHYHLMAGDKLTEETM